MAREIKGIVEGPNLPRTEVVIVYRGEGGIAGNNPPNHEKVDIVYKEKK